MASVNSIGYETSKSEFLTADEVAEVEKKLSSGELKSLDSDFTQKLNAESERGLSTNALNIEGRAPLNEVTSEILARLKVTTQDITDIGSLSEAEGNKHRKDEADKWWKEVKKHYVELCDNLQETVNNYNKNDNLKYKDGKDDDGNTIYKYHQKCSYTIDPPKEVIENTPPKDGVSGADAVKSAYKKASEFYSKVEEAKQYKAECDGLEISMGNYTGPVPVGKDVPEGVQPGAKVVTTKDDHGHEKSIYTNPDGSTVSITKNKDGKITEHRIRNRYGYINESIIYDKDGNIDHKNVYKYKKTEKEHVYQATQEQYEYKDGKYSEEPTKVTENYGNAYFSNEKDRVIIRSPEKQIKDSDIRYSATTAIKNTESTSEVNSNQSVIQASSIKMDENGKILSKALSNKKNWSRTKVNILDDYYEHYSYDGVSIATTKNKGEIKYYTTWNEDKTKIKYYDPSFNEITAEEVNKIKKASKN